MSSKRRVRRDEARAADRECGRKRRHPSYEDATAHNVALQRNQHDFGLTVYRCRHCGGWHVGHSPFLRG